MTHHQKLYNADELRQGDLTNLSMQGKTDDCKNLILSLAIQYDMVMEKSHQEGQKKMELVNYDEATKEYTVKMKQDEFLDLFDMVGGVYSTGNLQDFTALGVTEDRVLELSDGLRKILDQEHYGSAKRKEPS